MNLPCLPFVWVTQDGEEFTPAEMKTSHLFYTLRMIFNHTAPACYQISGCKRYRLNMPRTYLRLAVGVMVDELKARPSSDLAPWQWDQIFHIATVCRVVLSSKLN